MRAFLGTGLLGAGFVQALLRKGEQVQIWNRTAAKAKALEAHGAAAFEEIARAVRGADIIHLALKDDDSVNAVLAQAVPGLKPGATFMDHTTTSAAGAVSRTQYWKARGHIYLHAPVFMGPQNALDSTGYMLVSGDQDVIAQYTPLLSAMTGKLLNLGDREGKAAGMKLIGNLFLMALTGGLSDMLALAKASDISLGDIRALLQEWNPGAAVEARLRKMTGGSYGEPSWELAMARKDAGLMMAAAQAGGSPLSVIPAIAAEMDRWIERGHGSDDWTVIARDHIPGDNV